MHSLLPFFIAIPVTAAFLIAVTNKWVKSSEKIISFFAVASLFVFSIAAFKSSQLYPIIYRVGGWVPPLGISFVLDALSSFMLATVNTVALAVTVYSWSYMKQYTSQWKYYSLLMLLVAGVNGIILTGDIFNLYLFLETTALASYALVAFGCEQEDLEGSIKYLIFGVLASSMILIGIALTYAHTSTLNLADIAVSINRTEGALMPKLALLFFLIGFSIKTALVPFHAWLPDAYPPAPAPVSAILAGVITKTLGLYTICRVVFNVFGMTQAVSTLLLTLGALSMTVGVILALHQWDFKRLLAYHSISQIGYIVMGIGLATPLGIAGGLYHLFNHSVFKSLLFLNAGAVEYSAGTRQLQKMGGLREKMPVTANTSLIASMSIAGMPPFNGFWSKLMIIIALVQANHPWLALTAVIVSIITLASFLKVQKYAFWGELKENLKNIKEAPLPMILAMSFLAVLCILGACMYFEPFNSAILKPAAEVLISGLKYGSTVIGSSSQVRYPI